MSEKSKKIAYWIVPVLTFLSGSAGTELLNKLTESTVEIIEAIRGNSDKPKSSIEYDQGTEFLRNYANKQIEIDTIKAMTAN